MQGDIVAKYTYDAWGDIVSVTDANGNAITNQDHVANQNPIRYRGYYYDTESGLYYLNSRYYDPVTGRFVNADSQLNPNLLGKNLFSYCENNPVQKSDFTGLYCGFDDLIAGAVGAIVGVGGQLVSDLVSSAVNGEWSFSSLETYIGAGVGGAAGGIVTLYAGPVVGAAVSGGASTLIGQGLEKITGRSARGWNEIVANTFCDAALSATFEIVMPQVNKITSGRNSFSSVYKSGLTKIKNGTAKKMSPKVVGKGIISGIVNGSGESIFNGVSSANNSNSYDYIIILNPWAGPVLMC